MIETVTLGVQIIIFLMSMFAALLVILLSELFKYENDQWKLRQIDAELKLNYAQIVYLTMQEIREEKRKNNEQ